MRHALSIVADYSYRSTDPRMAAIRAHTAINAGNTARCEPSAAVKLGNRAVWHRPCVHGAYRLDLRGGAG
jgi:hypothetical protein